MARAFLTGKLTDVSTLDAKDIRRAMPRFAPENYAANLKLLPAYAALAEELGCTPAQLALAWLLHKAPHIVPIPGTTKLAHLGEDLGAAEVKLSTDAMARVEVLINQENVVGSRYTAQGNGEVDTESYS